MADDPLGTLSPPTRAGRRSCSTSTARSRRSSSDPRTRGSPTRRGTSSRGSRRATRSSPASAAGRAPRSSGCSASRASRSSASTASSSRPRRRVGGDGRRVRPRRRLARRAEAAQRLVPLPPRRRRGRGARVPDPRRRRRRARQGPVPRWGRMVLEVRPPVEAHKGTAVRALVARAGVTARSTPGTTRPTSTRSAGSTGSSSASASPSTPARRRRRCVAAADVVVAGPEGVLALLRALGRVSAPGRRRPRAAGRPRRARTSSSVVRALPIASRSTKRPSSRVCERNTSPEALTRSSSASLSSSEPSRRKQTSEK